MPTLYYRLLIEATASAVYDAITLAEGLSAWWTPNAAAQPEVNSVAKFPFGHGYHKEMKIKALEHGRLVQWECIEGANEWIGTDITFRLFENNGQLLESHAEMAGQAEQLRGLDRVTIVDFAHANWKGHTPVFAECNYTWGRFLRSLKLYCETGKGTPWPQQHKV